MLLFPCRVKFVPIELIEKDLLFSLGSLYFTSKTEESLSPYFASNPPGKKSIDEINFGFTKLSPSCSADLVRKDL